MDILKKFRYNFHFWLKNCYQAAGDPKEEVKQEGIVRDPPEMPSAGQDGSGQATANGNSK